MIISLDTKHSSSQCLQDIFQLKMENLSLKPEFYFIHPQFYIYLTIWGMIIFHFFSFNKMFIMAFSTLCFDILFKQCLQGSFLNFF